MTTDRLRPPLSLNTVLPVPTASHPKTWHVPTGESNNVVLCWNLLTEGAEALRHRLVTLMFRWAGTLLPNPSLERTPPRHEIMVEVARRRRSARDR